MCQEGVNNQWGRTGGGLGGNVNQNGVSSGAVPCGKGGPMV